MCIRDRSYAAAARRPGAAAPNDVLGAEYIRALHRHASEIRPITVTRKGSAHDQPGSAGQIRSLIGSASSAAEQASWKALMPETAANLLEKEMETGKSPVLSEHFEDVYKRQGSDVSAASHSDRCSAPRDMK